ncbi:glycosyltransferase family 2 protein [Propionicicella superfundia]|uniref:glycosyltransferase family 2 protein n=1 Tax=Propionicicella superfundia TaxID=348582 RepID=UPI000414462E|nr:cellulose synthase catalytic subunit [Propionicicella superfundia]
MKILGTRRVKSSIASTNLSDLIEANDLQLVDGLGPDQRRRATRNPFSPIVLIVTILATLGVFAYGAFLLNPSARGDLLPWLIVIVAETILVFHALMAVWTMLVGYGRRPPFSFFGAQARLYDAELNWSLGVQDLPERWPVLLDGRQVSVAAFVTVYGEPLDVIRRTVVAAQHIRGLHTTYILDDGSSDVVRALAAELDCRYLRRLSNSGAKAGNINNALTVAKEDFFLILDADFVAQPEFLEETLPYMTDSNVAFVQTPQTYGNMHNVISRGAGYMQTLFYRFVQPGRNEFNAAFCVGTNVLFRRKAVEDVGGMYTASKSEDVWTSLMLHERGWRSVFVPLTLAVGDTPDTIEAYSKQQLRWATGGFEILFTHNPFGRRRRLTMDQRIMYFVTATHYLTGIVPGLLLFLPALEIFLDLRPVNLDVGPVQWALFYSGFYVLQIVLASVIVGTFRWEVLLLSANSFPIYLKALKNALLGIDTKWSVTGRTGGQASAFTFIGPQVLVFVFLVWTSVVGAWRDWNMQQVNIATLWCVTNSIVIGGFIATAFAEDAAARRSRTEPGATVAPQADTPVREVVVLGRAELLAAHALREALGPAVPQRASGSIVPDGEAAPSRAMPDPTREALS